MSNKNIIVIHNLLLSHIVNKQMGETIPILDAIYMCEKYISINNLWKYNNDKGYLGDQIVCISEPLKRSFNIRVEHLVTMTFDDFVRFVMKYAT